MMGVGRLAGIRKYQNKWLFSWFPVVKTNLINSTSMHCKIAFGKIVLISPSSNAFQQRQCGKQAIAGQADRLHTVYSAIVDAVLVGS